MKRFFFFVFAAAVAGLFLAACGEEPMEPVSTDAEAELPIVLGNSYTDPVSGVSFSFPVDWKTYKDKNGAIKVLTRESISKPVDLTEQKTEIEIRIKDNPDKLSVTSFYNGITDINLFLDANNGMEDITVAGYKGTKFNNVVGVVPADVVVVPVADKLYEFKLNDLRFKNIFTELLGTVRFGE